MAEESLKDFTSNWIIVGLLTFCLMSFTIAFMYNNNPLGLGDEADGKFETSTQNLSNNLYEMETDSNSVLNITANTNPEASDLGSRDSVASAYKQKESAMGFFDSIKTFLSWILVGDLGKMLISVFGGIVGFAAVYFIVKWIRNGL